MHASDDSALTLELADEHATLGLGARLATAIEPGLVIYLEGDLGAGKTTLVRGLLRALGYRDKVKSPTYSLVEVHAVSGLNLYHFDFYRFSYAEEYLEAGLDEYFSGAGTCLVEWPDRAAPYVPGADLRLRLDVVGQGRRASVHAKTERGHACLMKLRRSPAATSSGSPPPA